MYSWGKRSDIGKARKGWKVEKETLFGMRYSVGTLNTWHGALFKTVGCLGFQHVHGMMLDMGWQRNRKRLHACLEIKSI